MAARFLGFSTISHRVLIVGEEKDKDEDEDEEAESTSPVLPDLVLDNVPKLKVRLFQHAGLDGTKDELEFFSGSSWAELRGPWPGELLDPAQFTDGLAGQLWKARVSASEIDEEVSDQIQHFSCHCNTEPDDYQEHSLYLAHKKDSWFDRTFSRSSQRRVTIGDLERKFGRFPERHSETRPLIFFNACGSSRLTASGVTSFPDIFLEIGNRGFIGSETKVPDRFAAAFAKQFYWNLIRGAPLGEAIYKARWRLLKDIYNPLGILYSAYADPNLKVAKPFAQPINRPVSGASPIADSH